MSKGNHGRWPCPACGYKPVPREPRERVPEPPPGVQPALHRAAITDLFAARPELSTINTVGARLAAAAGENA